MTGHKELERREMRKTRRTSARVEGGTGQGSFELARSRIKYQQMIVHKTSERSD